MENRGLLIKFDVTKGMVYIFREYRWGNVCGLEFFGEVVEMWYWIWILERSVSGFVGDLCCFIRFLSVFLKFLIFWGFDLDRCGDEIGKIDYILDVGLLFLFLVILLVVGRG